MADNKTSIIITAEDKTQAALASVKNGFNGLTQSLGGLDSLVGKIPLLAGALGGLSFTGLIKGSIDAMAALDDMAEVTGATVESLSAISDVAKIGGHDLGQVEAMMIRLTKALAGGDNEAKAAGRALEMLGLSAQKLRGMETGAALLEVAKALDNYADTGGKAALITDMLGKSAAQQLPFLKDLAATGELNAKVTAEQAAEAEKLQKSWNSLKIVFDDAARTMAVSLMPAMDKLSQAFSGGIIDGFVSRWGAAFKGLAAGISETMATAEEFLGKITFGAVAENHLKKALAYRDAAKKIYAELSALAPVGTAYSSLGAAKPALDYTSVSNSSAAKLAKSYDAAEWMSSDMVKMMREEEQLMKRIADDAERRATAEERANQALIDMTTNGKLDDLAEKQERAARLLSEGRISFEGYDEILNKLGGITYKIQEQTSMAKELGLTFTSAFEDAIVGGKKFSDVLKGLAQDILRMLTRKNITEPLAAAVATVDWSSFFKTSADGNVFAGPGISAYSGQVVSRPTLFPFAAGIGLMGEAGSEAILPLKRRNGVLGVEGGGSNVVVNVIESPGNGGKQDQRQQGGISIIDIFVERIKSAVATDIADGRGGIPSALQSAYGLNRAAGAF